MARKQYSSEFERFLGLKGLTLEDIVRIYRGGRDKKWKSGQSIKSGNTRFNQALNTLKATVTTDDDWVWDRGYLGGSVEIPQGDPKDNKVVILYFGSK